MDVLGQMADGVARRSGDCAGVLVFFPEDHAEECGLAVAVPADKAYSFAGIHGKADAVKQNLLAVGFFDIRDLKHSFKPLRGDWMRKHSFA
jgi:hypothetical protein